MPTLIIIVSIKGMARMPSLIMKLAMPVSPYPTFPRTREKGQTNRYASFTSKLLRILQQKPNAKAARRRPCRMSDQPFIRPRRVLTLGELLAAARLAQTDFFTFDFTRIAGNQTGLFQHSLERSVVIDQRTGDAVTHRTGLAGFAATGDVHHDIELAQRLGQRQRLAHDHAAGFTGKKHVHRLVVHHDVALARLDEHARHRTLAATGTVVITYAHDYAFNKLTGFGCCASCGCAAPAYTFILRNIA